MGEVYRARDGRLGRDVAIKVLPARLSADADRLRRFEQEARAAAALNHPNILTIHEIGSFTPDATAASTLYVVSELLEGETLRDAFVGGALPIRKAVDYAIQIASGLAAAHDKGIVHRDLKPENLFITRDGRVKILDFGLAKLIEPEAAAGMTTLATRAMDTGAGTVLGTAGYMSPEQVRALPVDHRTDVFSFGAVLYEMVSGTRAFRGETAADTISAILRSDPPELSTLQPSVPPGLQRIIHHCLEKAPEMRFQAARDIVFNLETLSSTSVVTTSLIAAPAASNRRTWIVFAAAVAIAAVAGAAAWRLTGGRHDVAAFRQVTYRHGALALARFTPDGQNIVYTAAWETSPPEIFTVPATETGGRSLEIKNAHLLAIARSGELAVALNPTNITSFLFPGTFARGSMNAGAPKPEIENVAAADYTRSGSGLAIIRAVPGERACTVEYPVGTVLYRAPFLSDLRFSPDDKYLAFIEHPGASEDRGPVVVIRTDGTKVVTGPVEESHRGLTWSPSGDEVWTTAPLLDGTVRALDLRGRTRQVLNIPGRVTIRDVAADGRVLLEQGTSRRGMVVVTGNGEKARDLTWLDYSYVRAISDDGQMVLFEEESTPGYRTYVRNVDGSPAIAIGTGYGVTLSADKVWALSLHVGSPVTQLWLNPVGAGQPRRISPDSLAPNTAARFFRDGKRIAYAASESGRPPRTYVQDLNGGAPRAISEPGVVGAFISPDEKWIAATAPSGAVLLPVDGGATVPVQGFQRGDLLRGWSSDGQLYIAGGNQSVIRIERLDPRTGKRTPFRQAPAPAIVGVRLAPPFITPDGSAYTYGYQLSSSDLYVVSGAK
jgi:WD40 repeat protein